MLSVSVGFKDDPDPPPEQVIARLREFSERARQLRGPFGIDPDLPGILADWIERHVVEGGET